jgi:hypothetical protein
MKRRPRALCLTSAVLLAAVTPLLIVQQPASAADNYADKQGQITFIDDFGQAYTCPLNNDTDHNTDNSNQPYTHVDAFAGGQAPCYQGVDLTVTIHYKDKNGVARQASAEGSGNSLRLTEPNTYSAITTTVTAHYYSCDANASASCDLAVTVAPK